MLIWFFSLYQIRFLNNKPKLYCWDDGNDFRVCVEERKILYCDRNEGTELESYSHLITSPLCPL